MFCVSILPCIYCSVLLFCSVYLFFCTRLIHIVLHHCPEETSFRSNVYTLYRWMTLKTYLNLMWWSLHKTILNEKTKQKNSHLQGYSKTIKPLPQRANLNSFVKGTTGDIFYATAAAEFTYKYRWSSTCIIYYNSILQQQLLVFLSFFHYCDL